MENKFNVVDNKNYLMKTEIRSEKLRISMSNGYLFQNITKLSMSSLKFYFSVYIWSNMSLFS